MGLKSFSFIRLPIFGTGHTLATFQLSGKISLSILEFIIWTTGEVISSATGLRNFTGTLSTPQEQSFFNSDIIFFTPVQVVCCITKVLSFSNSGKIFVNNNWWKAIFSCFVSVETSSVYRIGLRLQDRVLFNSLVDQVYD